MGVLDVLRRVERATRPADPVTAAALQRRWQELPGSVQTAAQSVGRHAVGCEGTHGVFPKCNLTCLPCYHSKDANKVRVDGDHTVAEVTRQMAFLRQERGPHAHAQLIGGEVSLLSPDAHAAALAAMRAHGREPMSMTHGDFDLDYLRALVLGPDGRPRLRRVSFAAHFDSLMRGRRGIPRPRSEAELNPYRARFADMFRRLRREHGVRSYLAHTMTVTPQNLAEVGEVVASVPSMGYSMMSFQPAARVGDDRRWRGDLDEVGIDDVWQQIEGGVRRRVAWEAVQFGDPRCNRTAFGLRVDGDWFPFLDPNEPGDLEMRDWFYSHLAGMEFVGVPKTMVVLKLLRCFIEHPSAFSVSGRYVRRMAARVGGVRKLVAALVRQRAAPLTFVVHHFMNAEDVAPAWQLMEAGVAAEDPRVRVTQERLQACVYTMAHPETGRLIPACVQHSVLDPGENRGLRTLLPLTVIR
jgi:hypothetical protein